MRLNSVITNSQSKSQIKVSNFQAMIDNQYTHNRNSEDNSALAMSGMEPREKTLQVNLHLNTDMIRMQKEGQTFNVL